MDERPNLHDSRGIVNKLEVTYGYLWRVVGNQADLTPSVPKSNWRKLPTQIDNTFWHDYFRRPNNGGDT